MAAVKEALSGDQRLSRIRAGASKASESRAEFERRLRRFKGIGPVTVRIFMREAGSVLFPS
jgi:hypothetical protein